MVEFRLNILKGYSCYLALLLSLFLRFFPSKLVLSFYKRIKLDARYVWEFERLHWLSKYDKKTSLLRLYYFLTPVSKGVAWGCAMESAFRVFNIAYNKDSISEAYWKSFLLKECIFIRNNLEVHSNNNHILFNYAGLFICEQLLEKNSFDARDAFLNCVANQFSKDGTNFEASSAYHLLSLECISIVYKLFPSIREGINRAMQVEKALSFILAVKNENSIFLIGDNDSSHCIKSRYSSPNDRLSQIEFIKNNFEFKNIKTLSLYSDFGLALFKNDVSKLIVNNLQPGQNGKCGHDHNDYLSICFMKYGLDFIIDPGVFLYSQNRNYYRSVKSHSAPYLIIDEEVVEPELFTGNFSMSNRAIRELYKKEDRILCSVTFQHKGHDFRLSRSCIFTGESYLFEDKIEYDRKLNMQVEFGMSFCLAPNVEVQMAKDKVVLEKCGRMVIISANKIKSILVEPFIMSDEYGSFKKTKIVRFNSSSNKINWIMS